MLLCRDLSEGPPFPAPGFVTCSAPLAEPLQAHQEHYQCVGGVGVVQVETRKWSKDARAEAVL